MPSQNAHTWLELPPSDKVDPNFQTALNDSLRQIALQLDSVGSPTAKKTGASGQPSTPPSTTGATGSGTTGAPAVTAVAAGDASALNPKDPKYMARWADSTGSPHTAIWVQPVVSGTLPEPITVYYNAGDGKGWQYMASFNVTKAGEVFYMPGGWWVPTQAKETWQVAAIAGFVPGAGAVSALPNGAVLSATFVVLPVGSIDPAEFTLAFEPNSAGSLYDFAGPFNPGYYTWRFHDLDITFPAADVNLWDVVFTVQEGYVAAAVFTPATDATGTERQFLSVAGLMGWDSVQPAMGTTVHVNGPTAPVNGVQVPDWTFQSNTTNWVVRIRGYGVSRLGTGPTGGTGTRTQLTGWQNGADHWDLTPGAPPAALVIGTIAASDIVGSITAAQIGTVNASSIVGTITSGQIGSVAATQITGSIVATQIGSVAATTISGVITAGQIGSVAAATITGVIVSSQLVSQIINSANLIDSAILTNGLVKSGSNLAISPSGMTSGTWTASQIASVNASALVGLIVAGQINTIAASQITGQVTSTQIASVAASTITGTLTSTQIGSVAASTITGTLTSTQIGSINASTITIGLIGPSQISSINASQINAGTITVGSGGITFSGTGGITIAGSGNIYVTPGNITSTVYNTYYNSVPTAAAYEVNGSTVINAGSTFVGSGGVNTTGSVAGASFSVGSTSVINTSGQFVGPGMSTTTGGIGGVGFNVYQSGWYYGVTGPTTFTTADGHTVTVRGGVIVSIV